MIYVDKMFLRWLLSLYKVLLILCVMCYANAVHQHYTIRPGRLPSRQRLVFCCFGFHVYNVIHA